MIFYDNWNVHLVSSVGIRKVFLILNLLRNLGNMKEQNKSSKELIPLKNILCKFIYKISWPFA